MYVGRGYVWRIMLVLLAALVLVVACGPASASSAGSGPNIVQLNGMVYQTRFQFINAGRPLTAADLGPVHATVRYRIEGQVPPYDFRFNGRRAAKSYATPLAVGTALYTVNGYAPTFRLVAEHQGQLVLFEAVYSPHADRGADLFDIAGKVQSISVHDTTIGMPQIAMVDDPHQVATLVDLIGQAQKFDALPPFAPQYFVLVFHLHDGTVVERVYNFAIGGLSIDLELPRQFQSIMQQIIFPSSPAAPIAP